MTLIAEEEVSESIKREPEFGLVVDCLWLGIRDALEAMHKGEPEHLNQDIRWLTERSTRPFSFLWCCSITGIDADAVIEAARRDTKGMYERLTVRNRGTKPGWLA